MATTNVVDLKMSRTVTVLPTDARAEMDARPVGKGGEFAVSRHSRHQRHAGGRVEGQLLPLPSERVFREVGGRGGRRAA